MPGDPDPVARPRVTVFIPTKNRSAYLRGAIESVLGQTFEDFSLVVADNASTDDTADVVASFSDPRISYSRLEEDIGLVPNHNRCLELARTEYVSVLPDDDVWRPDRLASTVRVLERHPTVGVVHSSFDVLTADGEPAREDADWTGLFASEDVFESGRVYIERALDTSIRVHTSTALFRTAALPRVKFDLRDYPPVDLALMARIALDWDFYFIKRPLVAIRIHRDSFSAENAGTYTDTGFIEDPEYIEKVTEIKLRFLAENADRLAHVAGLRRRARRANTDALVNAAGRRTMPDRDRRLTGELLLETLRRDRRTLFNASAWRLLVASLLGPAAVDRYKSRRASFRAATAGGKR